MVTPEQNRRHPTVKTALVLASAIMTCALVPQAEPAAHPRWAAGDGALSAACAPGSVAATIQGARRCLTAGARCRSRFANRYRRYGLLCRHGRLRYPVPARVSARIAVPDSGALAVGSGSVWVIDREKGEFTEAGVPKGALYRVDPVTNRVSDQIPGVIGASIAFDEGDVWVATPALNRVLRIVPATHTITRIATGVSEDEYPTALAVTPRGVWVANHHGGTIVRIDPQTNQIAASVRWAESELGGPQRLATDSATVWAITSRETSVLEIDASSDRETRRISTAPAGTCGGIAADTDAVWVASGYDLPYPCWVRPHWGLTRVDRATGAVKVLDIGGERPFDVREAFGAVWVLTDFPHTDLFKVDPDNGRVLGRLRLREYPNYNDALAVGFGALWVRVVHGVRLDGNGYRTQPDPTGPGALLRIEPSR